MKCKLCLSKFIYINFDIKYFLILFTHSPFFKFYINGNIFCLLTLILFIFYYILYIILVLTFRAKNKLKKFNNPKYFNLSFFRHFIFVNVTLLLLKNQLILSTF